MLWSFHNSFAFLLIHWIFIVNCDNSSQLVAHHQNKLFIERQTHLITAGFSSVFWNHIRNQNSTETINNVSSRCSSSLNKLLQSTLNGQVWALKFLSYSGSKPNDFLDGSYTTFGSYDSCLAIKDDDQLIVGKYCLTSLEPNLLRDDQSESQLLSKLYSHHFDSKYNLTIKVGLCIPSTCSSNDVQQLMSQALNDYNWRLVDVNQCEVSTTFFGRYSEATFSQKVFFWLFMSLIATIIWGTLIDLQSQKSNDKLDSKSNHLFWIKQFSVIKSVRSLFRKPDDSPKVILLDQLRLTCLVIVITLHSVMWFAVINASFLVENTRKGIELYRRIEMQPLANDWVTEGLIVVGGMSAATTLIKKVTPQTPFTTYLHIIIRRAVILFPALLTIISIEIIVPLFGSGPFFKSINDFRSTVCVKNFIYNLLHLQNFNEPLEICAGHTWSIAVEWQLFIVLCGAIYIYKRNYRAGLAFNLFLIVFGFLQVNKVIIKHNIIPQVIMTTAKFREIADRMGAYYVATEAHIWSYFLGLLIVIIMLGNHESKLGIILKQLRYNILFALTLLLSYTSTPWNVLEMSIDPVTTIIFLTVIRILVGIWCSLIILVHGKRFRKFLANSKSNDIYIYNDDDQQLKVDSGDHSLVNSESNSSNNNNDKDNLNNNQEATINQPKVISPSKFKSIHRFEIILRFYKAAYFIHAIVYAFYFTSLRTPLAYSFTNYVMMAISLTMSALFGGFIFYLLILGPVERIQYVLSKKSIKSKTS